MRKSFRFAAAALIAACAAPAAGAETLADALAVAYRTNPTIRAERARLRATEELKAQAFADVLPQIGASAAYQKTDSTQTINAAVLGGVGAIEQDINLTTKTAGVDAQQTVFAGFRNINAIRQAKARIRAGGAQLAATEQAVLLAVATAYFDVLRDAAVYDSNRNQVEVLRRQLDESNARFRVGEVTRTDVAQAEARMLAARSGLAAAQAQLAISRAAYVETVGDAPGTLDPAPPEPTLPSDLDSALVAARELAPAVVVARESAAASRRGVSIARGALAPTVTLTAGYQYAEEPSSFTLSDEQFAFGARASMPLFQGGRTLSRIREARALADSADAQVDEAERRVRAQVTGAWERLSAARVTIIAATAEVEANRLALDGVQREARLGQRSTLDVLDAEQEFLNAQVRLESARRDERVAAFSLLAAAGALNLDALGVDPERVLPDRF